MSPVTAITIPLKTRQCILLIYRWWHVQQTLLSPDKVRKEGKMAVWGMQIGCWTLPFCRCHHLILYKSGLSRLQPHWLDLVPFQISLLLPQHAMCSDDPLREQDSIPQAAFFPCCLLIPKLWPGRFPFSQGDLHLPPSLQWMLGWLLGLAVPVQVRIVLLITEHSQQDKVKRNQFWIIRLFSPKKWVCLAYHQIPISVSF